MINFENLTNDQKVEFEMLAHYGLTVMSSQKSPLFLDEKFTDDRVGSYNVKNHRKARPGKRGGPVAHR
jgi:hypothetical protein